MEVGLSVGRGAVEEDGLEATLNEAALEQGDVEGRVDGVAGEGVVELEAEVGRGRLRGRNGAEGQASGGGQRFGWAVWVRSGHCCQV